MIDWVARDSEECEGEVKIRDEVIEQVDEVKYLEVMITSDGSVETKIEFRIGNATRVIGGMSDIV